MESNLFNDTHHYRERLKTASPGQTDAARSTMVRMCCRLWSIEKSPQLGAAIITLYKPLISLLVARVAMKQLREDLIQEASLNLLNAVDRYFKQDRIGEIEGYLTASIRRCIHLYCSRYGGPFSISEDGVAALAALARVEEAFVRKHERKPSIDELAELVDWDVEKVRSLAVYEIARHENDELEDETRKVEETIQAPEATFVPRSWQREELRERLESLLSTSGLTVRQREVLDLYFGLSTEIRTIDAKQSAASLEEMTEQAIADRLHLSRSTVHDHKEAALKRLRENPIASELADEFLEY